MILLGFFEVEIYITIFLILRIRVRDCSGNPFLMPFLAAKKIGTKSPLKRPKNNNEYLVL